MKTEIKEIKIKSPGQILDYVDTKEHLIELYNYITNLEQENKYLKKINDEKTKIGIADHKYASKKEDEVIVLQSRIDKAIENIDLVIELIKQQPTEDDSWILNRLNDFKYLLNGGDE